ncbi:hypothetical protein BGZ83_009649 [Gryganskiella cystojenkinii]|nr:hypothetical protein BGZ83_009649 [Gryganskiella cystojenkinii]
MNNNSDTCVDILDQNVYDQDAILNNNNVDNNVNNSRTVQRRPTNDTLTTNNNTIAIDFSGNNNGLLSSSNTLADLQVEGDGTPEGKVMLYTKLLRKRGQFRVTNIELFFDLVFVYAISAISETMVEDLTWEVVLEMLVVTLAVWWSWVFSAWTFNYFNPDSYLVRISLMIMMFVSLVMSAVIPESYSHQSLLFAGMYVLIQLGRGVLATYALRGHKLQMTYLRLSVWFFCTGAMWLTGGAIGGTTRNILWTVAIVLEYMSISFGNYVPGLGRAVTTDWDISGAHLAERCALFIIIALGESIVVTGEGFKEVIHEPAGVGMFIVSFLGACAMWWIYFHTASTEATEYVEQSVDPGKMGRLSYTYIHVIMVIGIIWCAVADRISIEHPHMIPHHEGQEKMIYPAIMIGGPALFVLGHAMFRRTFRPRFSYPHLVTVAVLLCATPIAIFLPLWATALTTTMILFILSFWESYFACAVLPSQRPADPEP